MTTLTYPSSCRMTSDTQNGLSAAMALAFVTITIAITIIRIEESVHCVHCVHYLWCLLSIVHTCGISYSHWRFLSSPSKRDQEPWKCYPIVSHRIASRSIAQEETHTERSPKHNRECSTPWYRESPFAELLQQREPILLGLAPFQYGTVS